MELVTASELRSLLEGCSPVLPIDCRPGLPYSSSHIKNAINFMMTPLILRRFANDILKKIIPAPDIRTKFLHGYFKHVVLYAENENLEVPAVNLAGNCLETTINKNNINTKVVVLKGGFQAFKLHNPAWCTSMSVSNFRHEFNIPPTPVTPSKPLSPHNFTTFKFYSPTGERSCVGEAKKPHFTYAAVPCEKQHLPVEIIPNLFLGSAYHAAKLDVLNTCNIKAVINATDGFVPNLFEDQGIIYNSVPVSDTSSSDLSRHFQACNNFIETHIALNHGVFVHCQGGLSRAPSIVIAYLMYTCSLRLEDAFNKVSKLRSIHPNLGFMVQLSEYEKCLGSLRRKRRRQATVGSSNTNPEVSEGEKENSLTSLLTASTSGTLLSTSSGSSSSSKHSRASSRERSFSFEFS